MSQAGRLFSPVPVLVLALACPQAIAQSRCDAGPRARSADPAALVVTPTALDVEVEGGHRVVTTLGSVRNPLDTCFDRLVVEVKYFDADKTHVDTVTQQLDVPALAGREVAFRVRDAAARDKAAYVSQSARIVAAEPRRGAAANDEPGLLSGLLLSWGPMLLLIAVWAFFIRRANRAGTPGARVASAAEAQVAATEAQTRVLAQIAASLEGRGSTTSAG